MEKIYLHTEQERAKRSLEYISKLISSYSEYKANEKIKCWETNKPVKTEKDSEESFNEKLTEWKHNRRSAYKKFFLKYKSEALEHLKILINSSQN